MLILYLDNSDTPMTNNEADEVPIGNTKEENSISPPPPTTPPPTEEDTQELIVINENTTELDLNHGRIGKIENLEPLRNLER